MPEYAALRAEMMKQVHPARPDVNWRYAEKLCLSLFEKNGVELQTAAWYTQIRTQLAGLQGLNEGLSILDVMITYQWGRFWPEPVHIRTEILSNLSTRLQQLIRTLPLSENDFNPLYRAEQYTGSIGEVLQRLNLKHLCQFDVLRTLIQNSKLKLKSSDNGAGCSTMRNPEMALPAERLVYVITDKPNANAQVINDFPHPKKRWPAFTAGVLTASVFSATVLWAYNAYHTQPPLLQALNHSVSPLPQILQTSQIEALLRSYMSRIDTRGWMAQASEQMGTLSTLPPDWQQQYAYQLLAQIQTLWPHHPEAMRMKARVDENRAVNALPETALSGWHEGMQKLEALSGRLDALDGQRGKYITVSELKSVVFDAKSSFNKAVPVEEKLRLIGSSGSANSAAVKDAEQQLSRLVNRLAIEKQANN